MDAALAKLDLIDAGLVTLVDIEGAPFSRAVVELDLPSGEAASASPALGSRSAPRSTGISGADAFAVALAPWQTLAINPGSDQPSA